MNATERARELAAPEAGDAALMDRSGKGLVGYKSTGTSTSEAQDRWQVRRVILFSGQYFTLKDQPGVRYESISIAEIMDLVRAPAAAEKQHAPATIGSTYCEHDARSHDVQRKQGQYALLRFDIDSGNLPLEELTQAFAYALGGNTFLVYSTSSAGPTNRRWRVLVPLLEPVGHDVRRAAEIVIRDDIGVLYDIEFDQSLDRAGQYIYLPTVAPLKRGPDGVPLYYEYKIVDGAPLDVRQSQLYPQIEALLEQEQHQLEEQEQRRLASERHRAELRASASGGDTPIERANAYILEKFEDIVELALSYGYEPDPNDPNKLRSPLQQSGSYASRVQPDGTALFSLSGSDAEAGLGRAAKGGQLIDPLDLVAHFDHGGDRAAALASVLAEAERSAVQVAQDFAKTAPDAEDLDTIEQSLLAMGSESHTAMAFVLRARGRVIHVHDYAGWMVWDGSRWRQDHRQEQLNAIIQLARRASAALGNGGKALLKHSFARGVAGIAAADPRIARTIDELDTHPEMLQTPGGVIDLRAGVIKPSDPELLITRCAGVAPQAGEPVRWIEFLRWALDGDQERIDWLQEMLGYCLTGLTGLEQAVYLDGPGGNGKGVIAAAMEAVLGDYFHTAPMTLLQYSALPQHASSLAALRGARMVMCSELAPGMRLDEQRFKALTGGNKVRANFMRQDAFEFKPEMKLWIASNHRPRILEPDEAMRRRLRVLSMPKVPTNPDPALKRTVIPAEAGRILGWLMEGCARVLSRGEKVSTPARVAADTEAYLSSQDALAAFLADATERDPSEVRRRSELYECYVGWARGAGEPRIMSNRDFAQALTRRGFEAVKRGGIDHVRGLRPRRAVDAEFLA